jgi:hypothetical protein
MTPATRLRAVESDRRKTASPYASGCAGRSSNPQLRAPLGEEVVDAPLLRKNSARRIHATTRIESLMIDGVREVLR